MTQQDVTEQDLIFLRRAIALAGDARNDGRHPFGALIVNERGEIIVASRNNAVRPKGDPTQHAEMVARPDMLQQFARYLADRETRPGHARLQVRVDAQVSLNGRRLQPMVDPTVDLAATTRTLGPAPWITELTAPRRKSPLRSSR